MSWDDIYERMAFSSLKGELVDGNNIRDALATLELYLQGQARAYEVRDALDFLTGRFGAAVEMASSVLRRSLDVEDEGARQVVAQECVIQISRTIARQGGAWASLRALE